VVAVLLSGRPLFMNPALNVADAFVAAWLPGSEGGGVADVLVGDKAGKARFGFKGTLPTAWPAKAKIGDGALYPLGYGLRYAAAAKPWQALSEEPGVAATGDARVWFAKGVPAASWSLVVGDGQGGSHTRITAVPASALDGQVSVSAEDFQVQEGARRFVVKGGEATVMLRNLEPQDIARETNGDVRLVFTMKANQPSDLTLAMDKGVVPLKLISGAGFKRYGIALRCFANAGVDMAKVGEAFVLRSKGAADFSIADVRLATDADEILPCGQ
jgi:beta-glucosidase